MKENSSVVHDKQKKHLECTVLSNKTPKMLVVEWREFRRHNVYGKVVAFRKKLYVHYEGIAPEKGVLVLVVESRPHSKLKRWELVKVLSKGGDL